MALAMISALTRRPVRSDLAMTGEITLRGRVLAIGGLKEKALAAHRVGIRNLIVPAENDKDLAEIPAKIRAEINVYAGRDNGRRDPHRAVGAAGGRGGQAYRASAGA